MKIGRKFYLLLVGGLITQASVSIKNSLDQLKMNKEEVELGAKGGFIFGWLLVAYAISIGSFFSFRTLFAYLGAVAIVGVVFYIKEKKNNINHQI